MVGVTVGGVIACHRITSFQLHQPEVDPVEGYQVAQQTALPILVVLTSRAKQVHLISAHHRLSDQNRGSVVATFASFRGINADQSHRAGSGFHGVTINHGHEADRLSRGGLG